MTIKKEVRLTLEDLGYTREDINVTLAPSTENHAVILTLTRGYSKVDCELSYKAATALAYTLLAFVQGETK